MENASVVRVKGLHNLFIKNDSNIELKDNTRVTQIIFAEADAEDSELLGEKFIEGTLWQYIQGDADHQGLFYRGSSSNIVSGSDYVNLGIDESETYKVDVVVSKIEDALRYNSDVYTAHFVSRNAPVEDYGYFRRTEDLDRGDYIGFKHVDTNEEVLVPKQSSWTEVEDDKFASSLFDLNEELKSEIFISEIEYDEIEVTGLVDALDVKDNLELKQDKLTAGTGITINDNVISAQVESNVIDVSGLSLAQTSNDPVVIEGLATDWDAIKKIIGYTQQPTAELLFADYKKFTPIVVRDSKNSENFPGLYLFDVNTVNLQDSILYISFELTVPHYNDGSVSNTSQSGLITINFVDPSNLTLHIKITIYDGSLNDRIDAILALTVNDVENTFNSVFNPATT